MLDAILVVLIIVFAISGYRQGFIVGVLSFVGFIGGGVLAALGAPPVIQAFVPNPTQQALIAIAMVFLFAALGQFFTSYLARSSATGSRGTRRGSSTPWAGPW